MKRWQLKWRDCDAACSRRKEFRKLLAQGHRSAELAAHELVFGELAADAIRYGDEPIWGKPKIRVTSRHLIADA